MMQTMERNPQFISAQLRAILKDRQWTQENLADEAGVSRRTVEKAVSGAHSPSEQTLRSFARALKVPLEIFTEPSSDEVAAMEKATGEALKRVAVVTLKRISKGADFLQHFGTFSMHLNDTLGIDDDEGLSLAAQLVDYVNELGDVWEVCTMAQRVEYAKEVAQLCKELDALGLACGVGTFRQQRPGNGDQGPLQFTVGVLVVIPADKWPPKSQALVALEKPWELAT